MTLLTVIDTKPVNGKINMRMYCGRKRIGLAHAEQSTCTHDSVIFMVEKWRAMFVNPHKLAGVSWPNY